MRLTMTGFPLNVMVNYFLLIKIIAPIYTIGIGRVTRYFQNITEL